MELARYSLRWGNPHRDPPGPRVLASMLVQRGAPCPAEVMAQWVAGAGYVICWELVTQKPIRRWSKAAKGRVRRTNLRRRLERKFPLLAEIFIAEALASRPGYYDGE